MTLLRYVLAASVAACLAGGAAVAQPASGSAPATALDRSAPPATETATPATSRGVNTSVTVDANGVRHYLITNGPVPDTPENRAKYGGPMSNGGRHTKPAGN